MPDYKAAARQAASKYGIDPAIFLAMIHQESGFNPNARSGAGAQGIAQFMPATARAYGVNLNDGRATDDLEGAARYLKDNLKRTGGDYKAALSIYNSGKPDAYKNPGFANGQTYNYVRSIMSGAKQFGGAGTPTATRSQQQQSTVTTTRREGQVDNSSARGALIASFLNNGDPSYTTGTKAQGLTAHDPLQFALGIKALKDNPGRLVSETKTTPGKPSPSSQPSSGGKHGPLLELFWQGKHGVDVKNGKLVPQGFVSGHQDHVHVASGPKTIVELGRLAQQMGLHVGENPHFGGVEPVHVQNSYHYRGQAIDVSGDPQKMARYAAAVARKYGIKVK